MSVVDPLQHYLQMSNVFGLSRSTATANNSTVGKGNYLLEFFGGARLNTTTNIVRRVICEKMKIYSFIHLGESPYPKSVS